MPDHLTSAPEEPSDHLPTATDELSGLPGWAQGPLNGHAHGVNARGSWLLEPELESGMLLYPRDWSFTERRDITQLLRTQGWAMQPRAFDVTSDGETVIRLLDRFEAKVAAQVGSPVASIREVPAEPAPILEPTAALDQLAAIQATS